VTSGDLVGKDSRCLGLLISRTRPGQSLMDIGTSLMAALTVGAFIQGESPPSALRIWILRTSREHGSSGSGFHQLQSAGVQPPVAKSSRLGCEGSLNGAETMG